MTKQKSQRKSGRTVTKKLSPRQINKNPSAFSYSSHIPLPFLIRKFLKKSSGKNFFQKSFSPLCYFIQSSCPVSAESRNIALSIISASAPTRNITHDTAQPPKINEPAKYIMTIYNHIIFEIPFFIVRRRLSPRLYFFTIPIRTDPMLPHRNTSHDKFQCPNLMLKRK